MNDWGSSSDADLRALGRDHRDKATPEELAHLVATSLRRGELPGIGAEIERLPGDLIEALGAARYRQGYCAWCAGGVHELRSGERACCCQDCFLERGALCFVCPRQGKS